MEPSQVPPPPSGARDLPAVRALPGLREVFTDLRGSDRSLRVTAHPQQDLVVLSIWREDRCVATVQLGSAELPALVNVLVTGLAEMAPLTDPTAAAHSDPPEHRSTA